MSLFLALQVSKKPELTLVGAVSLRLGFEVVRKDHDVRVTTVVA